MPPHYGLIMTRYAALLRGINVGGINIKMADLRSTFVDLGFENVKTVLASGNVLFDSDRDDVPALKSEIESGLRAEFHYEAWVSSSTSTRFDRSSTTTRSTPSEKAGTRTCW